jgi:capsular polysaccharide biosynthesis protein
VEAIRHDYESARLEETTLATALEEQKDAATDLNRKSVNYTVMQREAESNRELVSDAPEAREGAAGAGQQPRQQRAPDRTGGGAGAPFSPNLRRAATLGGVVALLVAVGLVLVLDYLDDTIKTPEDVTRLGLPFLGSHSRSAQQPRDARCSQGRTISARRSDRFARRSR